jgi:hypothetical protein
MVLQSMIDEYLYGMKWSHFELRKNGRQISLNNLSDKREMIKFNDTTLRVKHLIIHSNDVVGLWKMHQCMSTQPRKVNKLIRNFLVEYLYTDKEEENVKIGPVYKIM